jgi:hypothetical protein
MRAPPGAEDTSFIDLVFERPVHLLRLKEGSTQTVLESGTISDQVMDLFFPSIAANSAGTKVIAYNAASSVFPFQSR